jgi:type I site-specific restriction endonuclease
MQTARHTEFKITASVRKEIIKIVDERIREAHVTKEDFSELKSIVSELAEAQKRTEIRVEELAEAQKRTEIRVEELAEAQKETKRELKELAEAQKETQKEVTRLDRTMQELAEAQKRTEIRVEELAVEVKELARDIRETRKELHEKIDRTNTQLGGLSDSVAYALENEAYRRLPVLLKERYGIEVIDKVIRTEIAGEEINIFAKGHRDGRDVLIVGETKLKLQSISDLKQLNEKIKAVEKEHKGVEIVSLIITHYARPGVLERAEEKDIIIVQSYEW